MYRDNGLHRKLRVEAGRISGKEIILFDKERRETMKMYGKFRN